MKSLIEQFAGTPMLVTVDDWFVAPDGQQYKSAWGIVQVANSFDTLGIKVNSRSADWYATIGIGDRAVIVAGCRIHYAVVCKDQPNRDRVMEDRFNDGKGEGVKWNRCSYIYIP